MKIGKKLIYPWETDTRKTIQIHEFLAESASHTTGMHYCKLLCCKSKLYEVLCMPGSHGQVSSFSIFRKCDHIQYKCRATFVYFHLAKFYFNVFFEWRAKAKKKIVISPSHFVHKEDEFFAPFHPWLIIIYHIFGMG